MKCAELNCPKEIGGIAGQIGVGKRAKTYCLNCYRKYAKNPPPLPSDILSEATESTRKPLKGESSGNTSR